MTAFHNDGKGIAEGRAEGVKAGDLNRNWHALSAGIGCYPCLAQPSRWPQTFSPLS